MTVGMITLEFIPRRHLQQSSRRDLTLLTFNAQKDRNTTLQEGYLDIL